MTISISSLVIGCGLFFLAGAFTGVSIMCMLSVRKSRRLNANYFVSDSDTNKTIAGMPWQDLVLLFLETGSVALGLIMIGLLAKFRPKPRAWINTKKENKQKGEK